jgi:RNA polymerase sigma-70 factor (ECF subfamily)
MSAMGRKRPMWRRLCHAWQERHHLLVTPAEVVVALRRKLAGVPIEGDLAARVITGLEKARARWPEAPEPLESFVDHLGDRIAQQRDLAEVAGRLRADDLFLAWWALSGDPRGIAAFEAAHAAELAKLVARFRKLPADDLRQQLRIKLLVAGERPPKLLDYSGFGFLENWVRVTAARTFIDVARQADGRAIEEELDEAELLGVQARGPDPELAHERAQLAAAIKRGFAAAVAGLSPRHRTFLRHTYVDRLTLEQIASSYDVHRATVARVLATARDRVLAETRAHVAAALGVAPKELTTAMTALDSRLDLSLSRVLRVD